MIRELTNVCSKQVKCEAFWGVTVESPGFWVPALGFLRHKRTSLHAIWASKRKSLKRPPHRTSELRSKEDGKPGTSGVQRMRPWLESCPPEARVGLGGPSDQTIRFLLGGRTHDFFPLPPCPFCLPDSQHDLLKQATWRHWTKDGAETNSTISTVQIKERKPSQTRAKHTKLIRKWGILNV